MVVGRGHLDGRGGRAETRWQQWDSGVEMNGKIMTIRQWCQDNGVRMAVSGQHHCEGGVGTDAL